MVPALSSTEESISGAADSATSDAATAPSNSDEVADGVSDNVAENVAPQDSAQTNEDETPQPSCADAASQVTQPEPPKRKSGRPFKIPTKRGRYERKSKGD